MNHLRLESQRGIGGIREDSNESLIRIESCHRYTEGGTSGLSLLLLAFEGSFDSLFSSE